MLKSYFLKLEMVLLSISLLVACTKAPSSSHGASVQDPSNSQKTMPSLGKNQNSTKNQTGAKGASNNTWGSTGSKISPHSDPILNVSNDWPSFGNNLWQDRYSPDTTLTPQTVSQLQLSFKYTIPSTSGENESYPLEENGVLYVTAPGGRVLAMKADTGHVIWSYTPKVTVQKYTKANRGVALGPNQVFVLTPDNRLIALDKKTGGLNYDVTVADASLGYFETMAPQYADGKLYIGSSGGDMGVRGFMEAYDAKTGHQLWRFYTIPKRGVGWVPASGNHGGGAVWTTPTYDPETGQLFFGTGNPSPDYFGEERKGNNLYTDSVISLGGTSGKLKWYAQEVGHDLWDYDVASPPLLFKLNGRLVVGEAGKDGMWYEWTPSDGKWVVQPVAFVKQDHKKPTARGTKVWPGPDGGANYGPSAYDPVTQTVYVAGIDGPEVLYAKKTQHSGHTSDFGTGQNDGTIKDWKGTITAIDVKTGKIKWQEATDSPPIGGVTINAGGLVFFGQANGELDALNAQNGNLVWTDQTHQSIGSAPILFKVKGKTELTYVTGGAGSMLTLFSNDAPNDVRGYALR